MRLPAGLVRATMLARTGFIKATVTQTGLVPIQEASLLVTSKSAFSSNWGRRMAEKAKEIPMETWYDVTKIAAIIYNYKLVLWWYWVIIYLWCKVFEISLLVVAYGNGTTQDL